MKIEQSYIDTLLKPLEDSAIPTLSEYIKELEGLGVNLDGADGRIDRKFETHLKYMSTKKLISNVNGLSDLKSLGFTIGADGHVVIIESNMIMKPEKEEITMPQNINIESINSDQVQVGNNNSQVTKLYLQEVVEKVAASNDAEAKSYLNLYWKIELLAAF